MSNCPSSFLGPLQALSPIATLEHSRVEQLDTNMRSSAYPHPSIHELSPNRVVASGAGLPSFDLQSRE